MSEEKLKIFDLSDLSDLSKEVIDEIKGIYVNEKDRCIVSLFKIKHVLSIDEVIVGLSRKYNINASRNWAVARLYALRNKEVITKLKRKKGIYKINNNEVSDEKNI